MNPKRSSLIAFVILVGAVAALIYHRSILATHYASLGVQGLAMILMVWARLTLKWRSFHATADPTQGGIVTSGPYRLIRHPIYAAIFYFLVAGVADHLSSFSAGLAVLAIGAIDVRIVAEERLLRERYPEYKAYMAGTKRIIPYVL